MKLASLTKDETRRKLFERITSGEWWLIIPISLEACRLLDEIEVKYYNGEANADFETIVTPQITFARKNRMSAHQFAGYLSKNTVLSSPSLIATIRSGQSDIIFLARPYEGDIKIAQRIRFILFDMFEQESALRKHRN